MVYCGGYACLAFFEDNLNGFLFGLLLIAIGAGGIKPCVSANAILVLLFIPFYSYLLFPWPEKAGFNFNPYRKIGVGFLLTILAFLVIYAIQMQIDQGLAPNIDWQVLAYVIITAAEVLIYQTGLEYAYTQAPDSMKSTIMSFWLLTISLGNYVVSLVNSSIADGGLFSGLSGAGFYLFFIVLMAGATVLFFVINRKMNASG